MGGSLHLLGEPNCAFIVAALSCHFLSLLSERDVKEKQRDCGELYNHATQSLVGLKFRLIERVSEAQSELQAEIDGMIEALRELCSDLRPSVLDRMGLVAALRLHMTDFSTRTGLPYFKPVMFTFVYRESSAVPLAGRKCAPPHHTSL